MSERRKAVNPVRIMIKSEFYGSNKRATHAIGNFQLPHTCLNVAEEELKWIYEDLVELFGDKVSFEGPTTTELEDTIRAKDAEIATLKKAFDKKQTEVTKLSRELETVLTQELKDEDPRAREALGMLFDKIIERNMKISKSIIEDICEKYHINYDPNMTSTELFKHFIKLFDYE